MRFNKAKQGKATGIENIPNEILKSPKLLYILYECFKTCFEPGIRLSIWSKSIINPIPKPS